MKTLFPLFLSLIFAVQTAFAVSDGLVLTMVDVGAAECLIITVNDEAMIVDAGYAKSWENIEQTIQSMGIDSVSYFVITHPHADHIGSAARVLENYDVDMVLLPPITYESAAYGRFTDVLTSSGIPVEYPYVGDQYTLDGAEITVYGPHPVAYTNPNDWSIVLMIEYAGRRILLTGDIEAEAEYDLLTYSDLYPLNADVLKVAHHGSNTSSTYDFVDAVSPQHAIIGVFLLIIHLMIQSSFIVPFLLRRLTHRLCDDTIVSSKCQGGFSYEKQNGYHCHRSFVGNCSRSRTLQPAAEQFVRWRG